MSRQNPMLRCKYHRAGMLSQAGRERADRRANKKVEVHQICRKRVGEMCNFAFYLPSKLHLLMHREQYLYDVRTGRGNMTIVLKVA